MKSMKKGQAALEFLTTYGWALLVILVMIGALVYFGVLNPSKVLPSKCDMEAGFSCKEFRITSTGFDIILGNKNGDGIKSIGIKNVTSDAFTPSLAGCTITPDSVIADQDLTLSCVNQPLAAATGSKVKIDFIINYTMVRGTYTKTASGNIYSAVQ